MYFFITFVATLITEKIMATQRKTRIFRTIVFEGETSKTTITIEDYIREMKSYGQEKSRTTRTARKYLRSLGLELDTNGEVIGRK